MTEFLIFLALTVAFAGGLWLLLRKRPEKHKAVWSETAWPSLALGPEHHVTGNPDPEPFGENITSPDSRVIPSSFVGSWNLQGRTAAAGGEDLLIVPNSIRLEWMEFVVAVRMIDSKKIAVVLQQFDDDKKWSYALRYFGLSKDGQKLTDLESADTVWQRVPAPRPARPEHEAASV